MNTFYLPASGAVYRADQLQANTGFSPSTDPSVLAANGIYRVQQTANPYDPYLYDATPTYTVVGDYAEQGWAATPLPLIYAKETGSQETKTAANSQEAAIVSNQNLSTDLLTAVSSQDPIDRPARFQTVLDAMAAVSDQLDSNLTAIDAATSVDEINNIVNKPTGVLFTGRGSGVGPEDLNVSYYTAFNSVSMTEADTELYVPSTAITIPYGSGGPNAFDSMGNAFNLGGPYVMQIRETATSMVIAEIEVPLNPAGEDVSF
jgi:hypothetical protein